MRVLLSTELFWPYIGGIEILSAKLIRALRRRGYEFTVVSSHDALDLPDVADFDGTPVHRFPLRAALQHGRIEQVVQLRRALAQLTSAVAPDLIHLNGIAASGLLMLQAIEAHPASLLVSIHQEVLPSQAAGGGSILLRALGKASWVSSVSAAALAQARELLPAITARSSVIHNGVDEPSEPPAPLPIDAPRLLCLGRLVAAKGFDVALQAFALLRPRYPHARLVIAGHGAERAALEQQVATLGLSATVDFVGWVEPDQVPALINASTLVVMPSRQEGLPLVAVQAALMARPIVATRTGGLPEVVLDPHTGLLVEKDDPGALASAIAVLLDQPETAIQMGAAGRCHARAVFGWERCVDAYDALYRRLA